MRAFIWGVLGIVALASAAPTSAQEPHPRRGFWLGFGIGGGPNLTSTLDDGSPAGFAGLARLGGTVTPQWLLGAESAGWSRDSGEDSWDWRSNVSAVALFYPSRARGLFLKAGPSIAIINTTTGTSRNIDGVDVSTSTSASEVGFGGTAGVGYDIRIARNLYLVPEVTYLLQAFSGRTTATPLGTIPGTNSILLFTLGLTWH